MKPFADPAVREKYDAHPPKLRAQLLALREAVFEAAAATPDAGRIEETLKWGSPSYLTLETKSGSTLRIDAHPNGGAALYVNCQSDLIEQFRQHYPDLRYQGFRAVVFEPGETAPEEIVRHLAALTLTYHSRKKPARR